MLSCVLFGGQAYQHPQTLLKRKEALKFIMLFCPSVAGPLGRLQVQVGLQSRTRPELGEASVGGPDH